MCDWYNESFAAMPLVLTAVNYHCCSTGGRGGGRLDGDRADDWGRTDRHDNHDVLPLLDDGGVLGGDVGVRNRNMRIHGCDRLCFSFCGRGRPFNFPIFIEAIKV